MKRFLRGCLLFLQCLVTWPWGIPWAIGLYTYLSFRPWMDSEARKMLWSVGFAAAKADWRRRLYWVDTGIVTWN